MNITTSNQVAFNPLNRRLIAVLLANSLAINTKSAITSGVANTSVVTDILIRNTGAAAVLFDVWIGANNTGLEHNKVRVSVPANAGNNGTIPIFSLATTVPTLFDLNLAGDRCMFLENTAVSVWLENMAALSASGACIITVKQGDF